MTLFSFNTLSENSLKCVSTSYQKRKIRTKIIDVNNNEPVFYHFSITVSNAAEVLIISMIHMLNCVFLMLLKT